MTSLQVMVDALVAEGVPYAEISRWMDYPGTNGKRDVETFLKGKSKNMDERIAMFTKKYAEFLAKGPHEGTVKPTATEKPKRENPSKKAAPEAEPDAPKPASTLPTKPKAKSAPAAPVAPAPTKSVPPAPVHEEPEYDDQPPTDGDDSVDDYDDSVDDDDDSVDDDDDSVDEDDVRVLSAPVVENSLEDGAMISALVEAGFTASAISHAIGYSGKHGNRDLQTFRDGKATHMERRRGLLVDFYCAQLRRDVPAGVVKRPATPIVKHPSDDDARMIKSLREAGKSDVEISVALGYSGKNGPRDVDTFLRGASKTQDKKREQLVAFFNSTCGTLSDADMVEALRKLSVSDSAISKALGFSGSNGPRDVASFLEGRCRDLEKRRGLLKTFFASKCAACSSPK